MERLIVAAFLFAGSAQAETFLWDAPTTWENGRPLVAGDIKSYKLYRGTTVIATVPGNQTSVVVDALPRGTHDMTVTAVSVDDLESDSSDKLRVNVQWRTLKPKGLRYTK